MNKKEAMQVLEVISTADGGYPYCITDILDHFVLKFPMHKDIAKDYYKMFSIKKSSSKLKVGNNDE